MEWQSWGLFALVVALLLGADLGLFQREVHVVKLKEALWATALRVILAMLFCLAIWLGWVGDYATAELSQKAGTEFLTCYIVEIALSVDNVFVFAMVFSFFRVAPEHQHRVLFWGILGALVMRAVMIFAATALLDRFHWVMYIFAAILIYGAIKMIRSNGNEGDPSQNPILILFRRFIPVTTDFRGKHFIVKEGGRWLATPLFVVLMAIETTDLIFAVDSIPAVVAITTDRFIVFTSNIFAILGLRAMYFALAGILPLFRYLHYGLSGILVFIGVKMLLSATPYAIGTVQSLVVVVAMLVVSVAASLLIRKKI